MLSLLLSFVTASFLSSVRKQKAFAYYGGRVSAGLIPLTVTLPGSVPSHLSLTEHSGLLNYVQSRQSAETSRLINMGGGGEVKGHLRGSLVPGTELTRRDKGFCELKNKLKRIWKERCWHQGIRLLLILWTNNRFPPLCVGVKLYSAFLINYTTPC